MPETEGEKIDLQGGKIFDGDAQFKSLTTEDLSIEDETGDNNYVWRYNESQTRLELYDENRDNIILTKTDGGQWEFLVNRIRVSGAGGGSGLQNRGGTADLTGGNPALNLGDNGTQYTSEDVRNISSPSEGRVAYHDGSGTHTEGPAFFNGSAWISTVDGSTID